MRIRKQALCHPLEKWVARGLCMVCYRCEYNAKPENKERARLKYRQRPDIKWRAKHLRRRFGITVEQYDLVLKRQGGVCAICGEPPLPKRRLAVDHCHESNRVRGLVCYKCNKFRIGRAIDRDAALYHKISLYLADHFDGRAA